MSDSGEAGGVTAAAKPGVSLVGQLWSDEPATTDFLAFESIAVAIADAVMDDALDPLAIGLSGPWGSGKTTVLDLVKRELDRRTAPDRSEAVIVVRTDPWRYDPSIGAKESLIAEVLDALTEELEKNTSKTGDALKLAKRLAQRVDWAKALTMAAKASLTLQLPGIDDLAGLIREKQGDENGASPRGLAGFRSDFTTLMASDELKYIRRVVVLVDDLDRCLAGTVLETLEAIRLFLSVEGMSFVIAADEERVADAIRTKLPDSAKPRERPAGSNALPPEEPSKLYLHKIVQTTVPLPALGAFDTESYLLLLQLQNRVHPKVGEDALKQIIAECDRLRATGALDEMSVPSGMDIQSELAFAHRLTSILYEKLQGNPRRIKRFLNDMNIRRSIAARRGIVLDVDVVAKLMVLEVLLPERFRSVLDWLRTGQLRDQLRQVESEARGERDDPAATSPSDDVPVEEPAEGQAPMEGNEAGPRFEDDLLRWGNLEPVLHEIELSPYLHLAASFSGDLLVSRELPSRLRDVARQLVSTQQLERHALSDHQVKAISIDDVAILVRHLGLRARDRIPEQRGAVIGIGRLAKAHPSISPKAIEAFRGIPVGDLQPQTALHLRGLALQGMAELIDDMASRMVDGDAKRALLSRGVGGRVGN